MRAQARLSPPNGYIGFFDWASYLEVRITVCDTLRPSYAFTRVFSALFHLPPPRNTHEGWWGQESLIACDCLSNPSAPDCLSNPSAPEMHAFG